MNGKASFNNLSPHPLHLQLTGNFLTEQWCYKIKGAHFLEWDSVLYMRYVLCAVIVL